MASLSVLLLTALKQLGLPTVTALAAGMVIGPAQLVARVLEFSIARHLHPSWSARVGVMVSLIGICLFIPGVTWLAFPDAALYGAGMRILTIARGTLPLVLFGPSDMRTDGGTGAAHAPRSGRWSICRFCVECSGRPNDAVSDGSYGRCGISGMPQTAHKAAA